MCMSFVSSIIAKWSCHVTPGATPRLLWDIPSEELNYPVRISGKRIGNVVCFYYVIVIREHLYHYSLHPTTFMN